MTHSPAATATRSHSSSHETRRRDLFLFIAAAGLPLGLCAARLNLNLWYDEACTIEQFVSRGARAIVTEFSLPNNHVFYSLMLRPVWLCSDSDAALRLPGMAMAVVTLGCVFAVGRRMGGAGCGAAATAWLGLNQMFQNHVMQVRGYGLSMLLTTLLLERMSSRMHRTPHPIPSGFLIGRTQPQGERENDENKRTEREIDESERWWDGAWIALYCGGLLYTIPSNVLTIVPLCGVAILAAGSWGRGAESFSRARRARLPWKALLPWMSGGLLAGLAYFPIAREVLAARGAPGGWDEGWKSLRSFFTAAAHDTWPLEAMLIPLGGWCWLRSGRSAATHPLRDSASRRLLPLIAIVGLFGPFVLQTFLRQPGPFDRTFSPLLPLYALTCGGLLWAIVDALRGAASPRIGQGVAGLAVILLLHALLVRPLATYPERLSARRDVEFAQDGYWCYYAARYGPAALVEHLRRTIAPDESYSILTDRNGYFTLSRYLFRAGLSAARTAADPLAQGLANLYYVAPVLAHLEDITDKSNVPPEVLQQFDCLGDFGYFRLYRWPVMRCIEEIGRREAPEVSHP